MGLPRVGGPIREAPWHHFGPQERLWLVTPAMPSPWIGRLDIDPDVTPPRTAVGSRVRPSECSRLTWPQAPPLRQVQLD